MNYLKNLKLKKPLQTKWQHNLVSFLTPVAALYLAAIMGVITMNNGAVQLVDFIPNEFVLGGITLYFLNGALDYLNKIQQ